MHSVYGEQRRVAGALCISSGILEKDNKRGKRWGGRGVILHCCYFFCHAFYYTQMMPFPSFTYPISRSCVFCLLLVYNVHVY